MTSLNPADLYRLSDQRRLEETYLQAITAAGAKACDEALLSGITAYDPALESLGIDKLRPHLSYEPAPLEGFALVRWVPTGAALMIIGEPEWPVGEYSDPAQIKVTVQYELIKPEDRHIFERRNG